MRRTIALTVLTIISWMLIAPLFAPGAEASLPPCCRRHGKHHCMMRRMERPGSKQNGLATASEKCPCAPAATGAVYSRCYKPEAGKQIQAAAVGPAARAPETDALHRISFLHSHPKRGPPAAYA
jgi:hypothetical protein